MAEAPIPVEEQPKKKKKKRGFPYYREILVSNSDIVPPYIEINGFVYGDPVFSGKSDLINAIYSKNLNESKSNIYRYSYVGTSREIKAFGHAGK